MSESKKYGFTMVELLGVILIIGVLALLLIPLINKSLIESKQKLYDSQIKNIELSAESWAMDHLFELPETEEETMTIYLWQLKIGGYIDNNVSDPKTGKLFPNDMEITIKKDKKRYIYNAIEDSGTEGNVDISNTTTPIIVLNGDPEVTVYKGETYVDMGAIAFYNGEDITSQIVTTNTVNTQTEGTYYIRYNINYNGKQAKEVTRTVNVTAPLITSKTFEEIMNSSPEVMNNDPDGNLRYVGSDPDNYVSFNNELWRIIGLFDGQLKIMKNDFYSSGIEWDDNSSDWSVSSLKNILNTTYLNSIEATSKKYIDQEYVWKLGGYAGGTYSRNDIYESERNTDVYSGHATEWLGAIGLMYVSDYGYSTSSNAEICDEDMWGWYYNNNSLVCIENSWIYNVRNNYEQWTLNHQSSSSYTVYFIDRNGSLSNEISWTYYYDGVNKDIRPTLYLKKEVVTVDGTGDSQDPYILDIVS